MQGNPTIICDPGTGYMKMGFAGDNFPKASFASLVGRPMLRCEQNLGDDVELKEIMVGNQASKHRALLQLSYPTSQGIIRNWQDMQILMKYSFKQLGAQDMRGRSVFLTQAIMNPTENKIGMMQMMFQKFQVNRIQYGIQALMSLYAEGLQTALLLDSGDGVTHCIPIFQGNLITGNSERLDIAGRHITNHLLKLLHMRGYAFNSTSDFETVRQIKQKFCFVSGNLPVDQKLSLETCIHQKVFNLPDGQKIKIGRQRFLAPQILMNPSIAGIQADGCGQMIFKVINKCDMTVRRQLYQNILISGGTSMLPGFPTRLREDMTQRYQQKILKGNKSTTVRIRVIDSPSRKYNVFIGASIAAKQTQAFDQAWKYKQQYDEKGKHRLGHELSLRGR